MSFKPIRSLRKDFWFGNYIQTSEKVTETNNRRDNRGNRAWRTTSDLTVRKGVKGMSKTLKERGTKKEPDLTKS